MSFSEKVFGYCKRCGGRGGDDPDATSPDADPTDTVGNGIELVLYQGDYICPLCRKELIAEEESLIKAENYEETQRFLLRAGVTKD